MFRTPHPGRSSDISLDQFLGQSGAVASRHAGRTQTVRYRNDGALKAIGLQFCPESEGKSRAERRLRPCESGSCEAPLLCLHPAIRLSSGASREKHGFGLIQLENVTFGD
jgi:hypothetical protein